MLGSIRWRLVISYAFLTLLTVVVVGVLAVTLVQRYVAQQEMEQLTANADAVARQALSLVVPVVRQGELQELVRTSAFLSSARVRILDQHGRVLADSGSETGLEEFAWVVPHFEWPHGISGEPTEPLVVTLPTGARIELSLPYVVPWSELPELLAEEAITLIEVRPGTWGSGVSFQPVLDEEQLRQLSTERPATERSSRVITVPIGGSHAPVGLVEISNAPDLAKGALRTTRQAFLLAAVGATALAVIVGLWVSQGLTAPLRDLSAVAGQMSSGNLSIRAAVRGRDEIGQLASQFNQMAQRLEVSFAELGAERDTLRRFIADASHQLRTPITALKNFVELLQGPAADDAAAAAEFLAESQVQVERLEWITRNLLDLSRLDAGLVSLSLADWDMRELIDAAASTFKPLAEHKGIDFSAQPPSSPVQLRCDRSWMELALSNLLDNAIKFTPAGGRVAIGAEQAGDSVRAWVQDTGPGIDPEDLPHIFERFYRGRNNHGDGSGLGLAIVQSVVHVHGGRVSVESEPGAGSLFPSSCRSASKWGNTPSPLRPEAAGGFTTGAGPRFCSCWEA